MKLNNPGQRQKAVLLIGLYTSQMLGLAFVITALPAILRQSGSGLGELGFIFGLGLVWSLKCLWAPLVDRFGSVKHGHYRSWIITLQLLIAVVLAGAGFFNLTSQLSILTILFTFVAIFAATQDIAVDALAVTILEPGERGTGNGIQAAGNLLGVMLGGGAVLIAYQWLGWQVSMLILAAGSALPLVSILRYQEKPAPADARRQKAGLKDLIRFFHRPRIGYWIAILAVFRIGNMTAYGLLSPLLVDLGWGLDNIGFSINTIGSLLGIAGACLGAWSINQWQRKTAMLLTLLLTALATMGLLLPARGIDHPAIVFGAIGLIMAAYGGSSAVMYTVIMDKSDPASAGTDFSLQMTISSISAFAAGGFGLALAESLGYAPVLLACLAVTALSMALVGSYNGFESTRIRGAPQGDGASGSPTKSSCDGTSGVI